MQHQNSDQDRFQHRRKKALAAALTLGLDSLLVTHLADVRYLTGFTGSNAALALGRGSAILFTDGRYTAQARAEAPGLRIRIVPKSASAAAVAHLAARGFEACAFDPTQTTVAALQALRTALPAAARRKFLRPAPGLIARLREIKDAGEIVCMRRAAALGCELFDLALTLLTPGRTEAEVAAQLELAARQRGADGMSFETIVASGVRSSMPHGKASGARLPRRGFVTLDFGVVLDGYCSDMTRTVHIGRPTPQARAVYHSVFGAQVAAVAAVRAGVTCGAIDEAARGPLRRTPFQVPGSSTRRSSLAKFFTHSTGHGVGLEIHEGPRVAARVEDVLEERMIVTVEPGVYIPGLFGVRIEDTVLVTATGCEVLTARSPKVWTQL